MAITVLSDVLLPNNVIEAGGLRGKSIRRNARVSVASGAQYINALWTQSLREYEVGFIPMVRAAWQQIEALFEVTEGGLYGFLLRDPKDSTCSGSEGVVAALGGGTYQLYKRYGSTALAAHTKDRKITRPNGSSLVVNVNGTPEVPTAIDATTGVITLASAPAPSAVSWTGMFYVPVHFQADMLDWTLASPNVNPDARYIAGPSVILEEVRE